MTVLTTIFLTIGVVLCIGLQINDFINYMIGESEDENA